MTSKTHFYCLRTFYSFSYIKNFTVKFVDAEDFANDKIRTHDLALEVNNITKKLHTQTLAPSSQEQLMFTQPKDPNNKNKPHIKKYCSYCHRTNHSISACFKN